jgi:hypothetical protein
MAAALTSFFGAVLVLPVTSSCRRYDPIESDHIDIVNPAGTSDAVLLAAFRDATERTPNQPKLALRLVDAGCVLHDAPPRSAPAAMAWSIVFTSRRSRSAAG